MKALPLALSVNMAGPAVLSFFAFLKVGNELKPEDPGPPVCSGSYDLLQSKQKLVEHQAWMLINEPRPRKP